MTGRRCRCGHGELLHELYRPRGRPAYRRKCTCGTPHPCPCPRFTPSEGDALDD